jgi:hypothetical protein
MTTRSERTESRVKRASACLAIAMACAYLGGCSGDDTNAVADAATPSATDGSLPDAPLTEAGPREGGATAPTSGRPSASFSPSSVTFGAVACGGTAGTETLQVGNTGAGPLTVTATTTGFAFAVTPNTLTVPGGSTGTLTLSATLPGSTTAGVAVTGSLDLFTNDPSNTSVTVPLSATPTGATLAFTPQGSVAALDFPSTEVGTPAPPLPFTITNVGNAPATFQVDAPGDARFTVITDDDDGSAGVTLAAGGTWTASADFTPSNTILTSATATVTVTSPTCGASLPSIALSGQGTTGQVSGWPTGPLDFGSNPCGGAAPSPQSFTLMNSGAVDARIIEAALTGAPGFASSAAVGRIIPANGGILAITVTAPAVPSPSPMAPLSATLSVQTDADDAPQKVALVEEPSGAVLAFDTSQTPSFGSFGQVVLLESASQTFVVTNTGNAAATVTLLTGTTTGADAGVATAAVTSPFSVSNATFSIAANGTQADTVTFAPNAANGASGSLGMSVAGPLCALIPSALPLSGIGIGAGPTVVPTSLSFPAPCGGAAPPSQTFTVRNDGTLDMSWSIGAITGTGAAEYGVSTSPPPGLLVPGASATVTVTAAAVPSPAPNPDPSAFAAEVAITTDVPLDDPHVVSLGETPLGDQLSFSVDSLRFGQFPIDTTIAQTLTVTNGANPGSPAANVSLAMQGAGASAYQASPPSVSNLAPGGTVSPDESITFAPTASVAYPATIGLVTGDALCAPLPTPVQLSGTGTQGKVFVSATTVAFGSDANDASGLVNCGATGLAHDVTVYNVGNEDFHITALSLGLGSSSPYVLSGSGTSLPAAIPIGGSATISVTPKSIPSAVGNPNDPSPFTDTLTVTTDAALDSPHAVSLVMQARGAIVASTPLATAWSFGTIGFGSIGTFTSTLENTGNAPVSINLDGLAQPTVFGIRNNPTIAAANGVTSIVGQFTPPAADGSWTDQATLTLTPTGAFCAPLPAQWTTPAISLSGGSNGSPAVTLSGSLAFPSTNCGNPSPAGRSVTLTNATNVAYSYQVSFNSGAFYTVAQPGSGTIPASGTTSIVVTPVSVLPGPGVKPGAPAYADDLIVTVATSPVTTFTVPVSWALNGAVLKLPEGAGPDNDGLGNVFYEADSTSGFALPIENDGTATASVTFAVQPSGGFAFSPSGAVHVIPGIRANPELVSAGGASACPSTTKGSVTFAYAGPVCQPIPMSSVAVHFCAGSL